ncbi:MAG: DUF6391 domain-containing protein [Anaerolineales bacterium]
MTLGPSPSWSSRWPVLSRIRRNHALEHATIHILSARHPRTTLIGRSDSAGFYLYGDVGPEEVRLAADSALARLRAGEHDLALHPHCGTSLLTAGVLVGTTSFVSLLGTKRNRWQDRWDRFPLAVLGSVFALIVARPMGMALQRHVTTQGDPGELQITSVKPVRAGTPGLLRVLTQG